MIRSRPSCLLQTHFGFEFDPFLNDSIPPPKMTSVWFPGADSIICLAISANWEKYDFCKVEKILKGSLDSIPSPSVKIQIMGGKVCLRCEGKTLVGVVNKLLETKKFVDITLLPQGNFPDNYLNFHWRWRDRIQAIFLKYFLLYLLGACLVSKQYLVAMSKSRY